MTEFVGFPKIPRLMRDCVITEKIDGTNAQILITEDGDIKAGSRKRWTTPDDDNFGFASWVMDNKNELLKLGPGRHFGEWWGQKIQRGYGLDHRRFSLFNVKRWSPNNVPLCCHVVPVLYEGAFDTKYVELCLKSLYDEGSRAAPKYKNPEGVIVYHIAANQYFKYTLGNDGHKGK